MPEFLPFDGQLDSAPNASAKFVPFTGKLDSDEPADLTKPAGIMGRDIKRVAAPPPSSGSVLEGKILPEPTFDPEQAIPLERRSVAEATPLPSDPRFGAPSLRQGQGIQSDSNLDAGARFNDAPLPIRALGQAVTSGVQGLAGGVRAVGDLTGIDAVSNFGAAAAKGANNFQTGMGDAPLPEGFGPKSPVPYLQKQAEGAAASLGQAAITGGALGSKAVIPALSLMTAGQEYDNGRNAGLSPAAALTRAVPMGAFEALGEKFAGFDEVTHAMGTLMKSAASTQAKKTAADVLVKNGIREVPGEVATYLGQTGVDQLPGIGINRDMTMGQFLDGLRDTAVQASMMGGVTAGAGAHVQHALPAAIPSADQMMRDRGFGGPARPTVQPAAISQATTVDDAIGIATAALDINPTTVSNNKVAMVSTLSQVAGDSSLSAADRILQLEGAATPAAEAATDIQSQISPVFTPEVAGPEAISAPEIAAQSATEPAPQRTFRELPPDELMALTMDPNSPANAGAVDEMRRRETDAAYRQREQQKTAEEEALVAEARDQQAAQATATGVAQELDAPTAMEQAFARARQRSESQRLGTQRDIARMTGEPIDKEWTAFGPQSGTKGIPRAEMPQIKAEHRGALTQFLLARDIPHEQVEVAANTLKPTQTEFSPEKVRKALGFTGGDRSILISSDGYILDGHHQFLAKLQTGEMVKAIRLDAPIEQLIEAVKEFPSADVSAGSTQARTPVPPAEPPAPIPPTENASQIRADAAAAEEQRRRPGNQARAAAHAANPMRAFLARHGVAMAARRDFVPGNAEQRKAMVQGYGPIFRRTGLPLDQLAQRAVEEGFLVYPDVPKLEDMMSRALNGERVIPQYAQGVAEAEMESRMERQRQLEEDAAEAVADVPDSILFELDDADIPWDAIGSNSTQADAMQALGFTPEEINASTTQPSGPRQDGEGGAQPRQVDAGQAQGSDRSGEAEARDDGLTSPTPAEITAQQDRATQGEREAASTRRQEEQRAQADAELGDFTLTGSDRSADQNPNQDEIPFSRKPVGTSISQHRLVEQTARTITQNWANRPEVIVAGSMNDPVIPQRVRDANNQQLENDAQGQPRAFIYGKKIYLIADQLRTDAAIRQAVWHEGIGHLGLRGVFGDALKPVLKEVVLSRRKDVARKSVEYGLNMRIEADRLYAAEEVLAEMAESRPDLSIVRRAIAAIRAWLRANVPGFDNLRVTNDMIARQYLIPARNWIEQGRARESLPDGQPAFGRGDDTAFERDPATDTRAFMNWFGGSKVTDNAGNPLVVYHGTDADFTTFDPERAGSNLGADERGFFFTSDPTQASAYAENDGANVMPAYVSLKNPLVVDDAYLEANGYPPFGNGDDALSFWREHRAELNAEIDAGGHDGAMLIDPSRPVDGEPSRMVMALRQNQVKSASGNRGTFNGERDDIRFARAPQIGTDAFDKWFKYSAVQDEEGRPAVVYHGTGDDFNVFGHDEDVQGMRNILRNTSAEGKIDGRYFFTDSAPLASEYATEAKENGTGANVIPAYLSMQNPLVVDANGTRGRNKFAMVEDAIGRAIDDGNDGVVLRNVFDHVIDNARTQTTPSTVYIAFRRNQVKSAVGNSGAFDPSNEDIRFARGANNLSTTSPQWESPEENGLDKWIYEGQNKAVDLVRVQQAIKESGAQIEERFDAQTAESLYAGRVAYRDQSFQKAEVRPLIQAMALNKVSMNEMADYLHARGAEERNIQIASVNPAMPDGGAGTNTQGTLMTTQAAKDYLSNIPAARLPVLQSLAAKVDAITKGTRDLLVNEGLEKRDVVNAWEKAYKNYVPMFRDEADSGAPHPQGQGFSVKGSSSKRATGSTKEVTNILAHVLMQREAAITRAEKNRVGMALYGLALTNPNPDFWTTIRPGMTKRAIAQELLGMGLDPSQIDDAIQGMSGEPTTRIVVKRNGMDTITAPLNGMAQVSNEIVKDVPDRFYKNLPGAIVLKVNGEDRVLMLNQKDPRALRMAVSLKNQDGLSSYDLAGTIVGKATRWLAAVNTQYNPVFGLVNGIRDTFGGAINLTSTPLNGKSTQVLWDAYTKAGPGIAKAITGKGANDPWAQLYTEFQSEGAQTGYREMFKDANDRSKALEKELKKLDSTGKLTPGNAWHAVLSTLDGFNNTIENAVRLSAYKTALDQGISKPAAAKIARELTVDFNRKGRLAREVGPLYAFFNASVQGSARTVEALKGPAGKRIILGGLTLGIIQSLLLASAGFDDDEISDFTKTRAFIIPMGGKKYMAIPLPLGLHVLPNTGRVLTDLAINGGKNAGKKSVDAIGEIAGAFSPLGGGNIFTADGFIKTLTPSLIDPVVEMAANKNFAGSPIERESTGERDPRPGFARAKESTLRSPTGQVYAGVSKLINKATLGTDYDAGKLSPTPEMLQYLAQVAGGGLLRETEKIINGSIAAANGEKLAANKVPLVGRFYGEVDADQVQKSRYIEAGLKIDRAQAALASANKAGDAAAMVKIIKDNQAALAMGDSQNQVAGDIAKLNKLAIANAGDREKEKQIDEARIAVMRSLNTGIERMEKQNNRPTIADRLKGNRAERDAVAAEAVAQ